MRPENRSPHDIKQNIRREMRARLSEVSADRRLRAGEAVRRRFAELDGKLFAFASLRNETDTWPLLHSRWQAGLSVALPKVEPDGIRFFSVSGRHELAAGTLGIAEPVDSCPPISPASGDTILVPGLAFTREGLRLGRGGGYYDRFLASTAEDIFTVGVCFDFQLRASLPCDKHDVPVSEVFPA